MMIVFYILSAIVFLLIILVLIAPKQYDIKRHIVINKPKNEVFQYLKFIKNQDEWSPWKKKDPTMKQTFLGEDGQVGFISKWQGNKDVGMGEQEILSINENEYIKTKLRFLKPWKSESDAYLAMESLTSGITTVTWGFSGKNPIPFNIFMLFFNMDKTVGNDFEEGLISLKQILER